MDLIFKYPANIREFSLKKDLEYFKFENIKFKLKCILILILEISRERLAEDRLYVAIKQNTFDVFRNYSMLEFKDFVNVNSLI